MAEEGWRRISINNTLTVEVPWEMTIKGRQAIDSVVTEWSSPKLSILVDSGPFVDQLQRPPSGATAQEVELDGLHAIIASFIDDGGSSVAAAYIAAEHMTVIVRADPNLDAQLPLVIIRTIRRSGTNE